MMLTTIASVVKVVAGKGILCRPLFNFILTCLFFFINVGLLIFYQDQVTVNQENLC